jgi:hypothetical protein
MTSTTSRRLSRIPGHDFSDLVVPLESAIDEP